MKIPYLRAPLNDFSVEYLYKDPRYKEKYGVDLYGVTFSLRPPAREALCTLDGTACDISTKDAPVRSITVFHCEYDGKKLFSRYIGLKAAPWLREGDFVKQGEIIGYGGKNALEGDCELEFQLWLTPKDFVFVKGAASRYAVDPLEYLYLYPGQRAGGYAKGVIKTLPKEYFPFEAGTVLLITAPENTVKIRTEPLEDKQYEDGFISKGRYAAVARVEGCGESYIKAVVSGEIRYVDCFENFEEIISPKEKNC